MLDSEFLILNRGKVAGFVELRILLWFSLGNWLFL